MHSDNAQFPSRSVSRFLAAKQCILVNGERSSASIMEQPPEETDNMPQEMALEKLELPEDTKVNGDLEEPPPLPPPLPSRPPLLPHPPARFFRPRGHRFPHPRGMPRHPMMMRGPRHPLLRHTGSPMSNGCPPAPPGIPTNLWEWFHSSDQDKDGLITATELQRVLLHGNWAPFDEETCRLMLSMYDNARTGTMNAYQLVALWDSLSDWQETFQLMDPEKTGSVGPDQLFESLEKFGYQLSRDFCDLVVGRFDKEGESKITLGDFIRAMVMLRCLTDAFKAHDPNMVGTIDLHYEQFLEMVLDNTLRQTA